MRSQMASAMVGSPMTWCHRETGSWELKTEEARLCRSSRISSRIKRLAVSRISSPKKSSYVELHITGLFPQNMIQDEDAGGTPEGL